MPSSDTQIKKGREKKGGRIKGTPNKATTEIKAAVMAAFDKVGGAKYLERVAEENPAIFCQLLAKIIPNEIKADHNHSGQVGLSLVIHNTVEPDGKD